VPIVNEGDLDLKLPADDNQSHQIWAEALELMFVGCFEFLEGIQITQQE